jgi:hypothetical protein
VFSVRYEMNVYILRVFRRNAELNFEIVHNLKTDYSFMYLNKFYTASEKTKYSELNSANSVFSQLNQNATSGPKFCSPEPFKVQNFVVSSAVNHGSTEAGSRIFFHFLC